MTIVVWIPKDEKGWSWQWYDSVEGYGEEWKQKVKEMAEQDEVWREVKSKLEKEGWL